MAETAVERFQQLQQLLNNMGVPYIVTPNLYPASHYSDLLFEWHSERIAPHSLLCRGGRYDEFINLELICKQQHEAGLSLDTIRGRISHLIQR